MLYLTNTWGKNILLASQVLGLHTLTSLRDVKDIGLWYEDFSEWFMGHSGSIYWKDSEKGEILISIKKRYPAPNSPTRKSS